MSQLNYLYNVSQLGYLHHHHHHIHRHALNFNHREYGSQQCQSSIVIDSTDGLANTSSLGIKSNNKIK